ncbi:2,3-bisphosphoglycerate-independent phosphoglycerate mutase [Patescibacteria group bacterium]
MQKENEENLATEKQGPVVLVIVDGWGVKPSSRANAISQAKKPNFDNYCQNYFCTTLQASGEAVGLPFNEMGNSEVGHMNIGAGRIVYQNLPRIDKSILDNDFFKNPVFLQACENVEKNSSQLHLIGLLSTGGVHASTNHLYALLDLAKKQGLKNIFVHAILDGRDMNYNSGLGLIEELEKKLKELGVGKIASLSGRWWAMDRDSRWDRIEKAYNVMIGGDVKNKETNALIAIKKSYKKEIYDEEFEPTIIINKNNKPIATIENNDSIVFSNYRADRGRQLSKAFVSKDFDKFERKEQKKVFFSSMTQYDKDLPIKVAYPPKEIIKPLTEIISQAGLNQLHIAETEKYAHVTYFFNGGKEEPFDNEEQVLVPSPAVENYKTTPEMSAKEVKDKVIKEVIKNEKDFIVINFANPDMVSHTGDLSATIKAVETVDKCLGEIVEIVLKLNGLVLITADHGNSEELINLQTGEINKEHSNSPVPFLIIGKNFKNLEVSGEKIDLNLLTPAGILADIAPTILKIMNIEKPKEMTGTSLI